MAAISLHCKGIARSKICAEGGDWFETNGHGA
jgi:hypothetical protein